MGQKVNPHILRIGIIRSWDSKWFADKRKYGKLLLQDLEVEKIIRKKLADASVSRIEIHRTANRVIINIHSAKPGLIIGRQGAGIEALKEELEKKFREEFSLSIKEISKPTLDALLLAESIARQVEKRISYRRACKMSLDKAMETGALGAKVAVAGRLNGVEISRSEFFSKGKIPLHTLRADIDFAKATAHTTYGSIGIKVWIYKGDIFKKKSEVRVTEMPQ
ncbi:30S ribosomal protein S3 [Patescibacteria group bacterium]|nr:30S ribosomal protein S3 [Patescibacteria group bacterium]MBU1703511.1 30S ribosomal protein S3 [Patescibacteria group bacterium]MBU1953418.1 30S ribosomal protein S3 [Patescibacteria group bacterium]